MTRPKKTEEVVKTDKPKRKYVRHGKYSRGRKGKGQPQFNGGDQYVTHVRAGNATLAMMTTADDAKGALRTIERMLRAFKMHPERVKIVSVKLVG